MIPARAASQRGPSGRNLLFSLFGPKNFSVRKRMNGRSRFISRPLTMVRTLEMFREFFFKNKNWRDLAMRCAREFLRSSNHRSVQLTELGATRTVRQSENEGCQRVGRGPTLGRVCPGNYRMADTRTV